MNPGKHAFPTIADCPDYVSRVQNFDYHNNDIKEIFTIVSLTINGFAIKFLFFHYLAPCFLCIVYFVFSLNFAQIVLQFIFVYIYMFSQVVEELLFIDFLLVSFSGYAHPGRLHGFGSHCQHLGEEEEVQSGRFHYQASS